MHEDTLVDGVFLGGRCSRLAAQARLLWLCLLSLSVLTDTATVHRARSMHMFCIDCALGDDGRCVLSVLPLLLYGSSMQTLTVGTDTVHRIFRC